MLSIIEQKYALTTENMGTLPRARKESTNFTSINVMNDSGNCWENDNLFLFIIILLIFCFTHAVIT